MTNITLETAPGASISVTGTRALSYAFDDSIAGAQSINGITVGNGNLTYTVSHDSTNNIHTVRYETYTSFNMPSRVVYGNFITNTSSTADRTLSYAYGPEHQRVRENVSLTGTGTSSYFAGNTWYLNGEDSLGLTYEKEVRANGTTENKHYLMAGGQVFAVFTSRTGTLDGLAASTTSYFQHDQLGSIAVVTDENGVVKERLAYDPWGKRRNIMSSPGTPDTRDLLVGKYTNRGFTEHEHLDEIGMIHMNGRIYDPLIGRFMSADPNVTNPYDLRSFNRYSYVYNNPLKLFDPTGFDAWAHENSDGSTHYNPTEHGLGNLGGSHSENSNNVASKPVTDPKTVEQPLTESVVQYLLSDAITSSMSFLTGGYSDLSEAARKQGNYVGYVGWGFAGAIMGAGNFLTGGEVGAATNSVKTLATSAAKAAAAATDLTAAQLKNVERFMGKVPANAKESLTVRAMPNEGVAAQAVSTGRVPGSSAVYEKQIDATGKTIQYTKTTYDPAGNIVHVKDKISGGVFP